MTGDNIELLNAYADQLRALERWRQWAEWCGDHDQAAELDRRKAQLRG